jgi:N-acetylglucosaminyltransferase
VNALAVIVSLYLGIVPFWARRQRRRAAQGCAVARLSHRDSTRPASVDVIVTCRNEQPALLDRCLRSLQEQDYRGKLRVWVVDDESENRADLLPLLATYAQPGWRILLQPENHGKRAAQALALRQGNGTVVVMVDSDTVIARDGVRRIVAPFRRRKVGAVTSRLRALNAGESWLAQAIDTRYELLCERERAAQSYFGSVLCCAGPFSAFRRKAVEQVLGSYLSGRRSGDDLRLTNLVLRAGYRSEYQPLAVASTQVPATIKEFVLQQRRWNRSFYRELPQMLAIVARRRPYMLLDLAARALAPALIGAGLVATVADAVRAPERLAFDAAALTLMALASAELLPSLRERPSWRFALRYGLVFVALLLPVRCWAACTVLQDQWGTRRKPWSAGQRLEQAAGIALSDLVALVPVQGGGAFQLTRRLTTATAQA